MTEIVLVRHAATTWSGSRYCGRSDPPLSDAGRAEAVRLGAELAPLIVTGTLLISSPSIRALDDRQGDRLGSWDRPRRSRRPLARGRRRRRRRTDVRRGGRTRSGTRRRAGRRRPRDRLARWGDASRPGWAGRRRLDRAHGSESSGHRRDPCRSVDARPRARRTAATPERRPPGTGGVRARATPRRRAKVGDRATLPGVTPPRPLSPGRPGAVRHRPTLLLLAAAAVAMLAAGCIGGESASTTTPSASLAPFTAPPPATMSSAPSALPTETPTVAPTPSGSPSESPAADAVDGCTGTDDNRAFFAEAAVNLDWPVYCAILPARWSVNTGSYSWTGRRAARHLLQGPRRRQPVAAPGRVLRRRRRLRCGRDRLRRRAVRGSDRHAGRPRWRRLRDRRRSRRAAQLARRRPGPRRSHVPGVRRRLHPPRLISRDAAPPVRPRRARLRQAPRPHRPWIPCPRRRLPSRPSPRSR